MENDLLQLWRLVAELTDQLAQNRAITASLQAQAGSVKSAASHQGTGFALRRFNMHMTQEAFESELERMNVAFVQQNTELQNDNKQLAGLLKEYEQTLENVMNKFRTHAHAAQQHELSLTRHYESLLLSRETSLLSTDLDASTAYSHSLARMSHLLRAALRACGGELPEDETPDEASDYDKGGYVEGSGMDDWALERESELARLEYENFELRRMLGVLPPSSPGPSPPAFPSRWEGMFEAEQHQQQHQQQQLGVFASGPSNSEGSDDLTLRRQPSHTQGQTQISLEAQSQPQQPHTQTQPLHIAFPPDTPLVARKYGRRAGSGSGSFIGGGGGFMGGGGGSGSDTSLNPAPNPFATFRPGGGGGAWQDSPIAGPGERNMNLQGPGQERDGDRERDTGDGQQGPTDWDGLTTMYLRGAGRRPPPRET